MGPAGLMGPGASFSGISVSPFGTPMKLFVRTVLGVQYSY